MRVLFLLHEQYGDYESEPGNLEVRRPALASGVVHDNAVYVYQRVRKESGFNAMVDGALELTRSFRPDIAIYVSTWPQQCLPAYCISEIQKMGIPVLTVICDTLLDPGLMGKIVDPYFRVSQYFCDAGSFFGYARFRLWSETLGLDKGVTLLTGNNLELERFNRSRTYDESIEVALVGSIYNHRANLLAHLDKHFDASKTNIHQFGGLFDERKMHPMAGGSGDWLPVDEYVATVGRCKILLCPDGQPTQWGVRGKIFEFMANGAFCLIENNPDVRAVIPADIAVTFSDAADCARKIEYYLANDNARLAKAADARTWYHETYNPGEYWKNLLEAMIEQRTNIPVTPCVEENFQTYRAAVMERLDNALPSDADFQSLAAKDFRHAVTSRDDEIGVAA